VAGLTEKPGVGGGTTVLPPPPPQEVDKRAKATEALATIDVFRMSHCNIFLSISHNLLVTNCRVVTLGSVTARFQLNTAPNAASAMERGSGPTAYDVAVTIGVCVEEVWPYNTL
jgi:hypothetical protein